MELDAWCLLVCIIQLAAGGFSPFVVPIVSFLGVGFPQTWWKRFAETNTAWTCTAIWMPLIAIVVYWLNGLILLAVDCVIRPEVLREYKLQPDRHFDFRQLKKVCRNVLSGQIFVVIPYALVCAQLGKYTPLGVRMLPDLPTSRELSFDLLGFVLFDEVFFYYSHRLFHNKVAGVNLYTRIHKIHHEFTAPIGLVASYCHPLEMLLSNAVPLTFGGCLMQAHAYSLMSWIVFAVLGTQFHHSGYRFPWVPSLDHNPDFHDFHHQRFSCNYGLLGWLDRLHGTDTAWQEAKRQEAKQTPKRSMKGTITGALNGGAVVLALACLATQVAAVASSA